MIKLEDIVHEQCEIIVMGSYVEEAINFKDKKEFLNKLINKAKEMIKKVMAWFKNLVNKVFKKKNENILDLLDEAEKKGGPNAKIKVINFIDWGGVLYGKTKHNLLHMSQDAGVFLIQIAKRIHSETTKFVEDEIKNSTLYNTLIDATSVEIAEIESTDFNPTYIAVKSVRNVSHTVVKNLDVLEKCIINAESAIEGIKIDTKDLEDSDGSIENNVVNMIKALTKYISAVRKVLECVRISFYGEFFPIAKALSQGKEEIDLHADNE